MRYKKFSNHKYMLKLSVKNLCLAFTSYIRENVAIWYLKDKEAHSAEYILIMRFEVLIGGEYEGSYLPECDTAQIDEKVLTFWKNLLLFYPQYRCSRFFRNISIFLSSNYSLATLYFELNTCKYFSAFILDNSKYYKL